MSTDFLDFDSSNINLLPNSSGVYMIKNVLNNKRYIGSSRNIKQRLRTHLSTLIKNRHHNKHLLNSYNKYGQSSFKMCILELCEDIQDTILFLEQKYLDLKPEYNKAKIAENNSGWHHTEDTKNRMSQFRTGKPRLTNKTVYSVPKLNINTNKINKNLTVPVIQYDLDDNVILEYSSISSAARAILRRREGIRDCCKGKLISAYGFKWRYKYE
ncbi:homing endonuclease [uncultured phage cr105_1]|uniref:homing endonuclease n=1 Tax=uncultured phage cr105_1 TaxID=2986415 RepID=UPI001C78A016|nr:homing endonuclease [uncultured phage cr105_1]